MKKVGFAISLVLFQSGCIGTELTGRDVDTNAAFPDLHSVPDRPAQKNMQKIEEERDDFEENYESKLDRNEQLRNKYHAPSK